MCSPAADELDDLKAVIGLHAGFWPLRARENIQIALDRHAVGPHPEMLDQGNDV